MRVKIAALALALCAPLLNAAEWLKHERIDKMTSVTVFSAMLPSLNREDIGGPYGVVSSAILVSKGANQGTETAAFSIQRGIISCARSCSMLVRFDDEEPQMIKVERTGNGQFKTVFFTDPEAFASKLRTAKRVFVRPVLYGGRSPIFEFIQGSPLSW